MELVNFALKFLAALPQSLLLFGVFCLLMSCIGVLIWAYYENQRPLETYLKKQGEVISLKKNTRNPYKGKVFISGEIWDFECDVPLQKRDIVHVDCSKSLVLKVSKMKT